MFDPAVSSDTGRLKDLYDEKTELESKLEKLYEKVGGIAIIKKKQDSLYCPA